MPTDSGPIPTDETTKEEIIPETIVPINDVILKSSKYMKKNGYKLIGWSTKNGSAQAEYKVGDTINVSQIVSKGKIITLYSVWDIQ